MKTCIGKLSAWLSLAAFISFGVIAPQTTSAAPAPVITTQPQSQSLLAGTNAAFSVVATGQATLLYQWSLNGTNLTNNAHINGATNATLTISNLVAGDAGNYLVVVSNSHGSASSSNATLTVLFPPSITAQPTNRVVSLGSTTVFYADATGDEPLFYQWRKNHQPLADDARITGSTSPALTISAIQMSDAGSYDVTVSNLNGTVTSLAAGLTVQPLIVWGATNIGPEIFTNAVAIAAGSYHGQYVYLGLKADGTIANWGVDVPATVSNIVAVSAGYRHGLSLNSNGVVSGYGDDSFGETDTPVGLSNVVDVAAGGDYSIALKSDGTITGWGYVLPPPGLSNLLAVSAGTFHSLAIKEDGTVTGWGYNAYGEATAPVGLSNVVAVSAGAFHSLALKSDGTVVGWGVNYYGESMAAPEGLSNVVAVAGGWSHALALRSDGTVVAWGSNDNGQANVPVGLSNVVAVAAGNLHSLALVPSPAAQLPPFIRWMGPTNRTVPFAQSVLVLPTVTGSLPMHFQWLSNNVPLPAETNRWLLLASAKPDQSGTYSVEITNGAGSVTSAIVALTVLPPQPPTFPIQPTNQNVLYGNKAVISASVSGTEPLLYQWQKNGTNLLNGGRLTGVNSASLTNSNTQPEDLGSYQLVVTNPYGTNTSAAAAFSVVPMMVWGYNSQGQTAVPLDFTNVISAAADDGRSIALRSDGTVAVWPLDSASTPPAGLSNVVAVAKGYDPCAALKSDGTIAAWGANLASPGNPSNVVSIAVGNNNVVVLQGDTLAGGLGVWPTSDVLSICSGDHHGLMVRDDGTVVGIGSTYYNAATPPAGLSNVVAVSVGAYHSLVLKSDGTVFAWGDNDSGQTNIPAGLSNVVEIAAGGSHNLALRSDGTVVAWGDNSYGESSIPSNLTNVVAISGGYGYSVAIVQNHVTPIPPSIWWPGPTNRILTAGRTVIFVPMVNGSRPMTFQWFVNGAPLSGQTNRWLELPSTTTEQSGGYYFTVTNQYGSATSPVMTISEAPTMLSQPLNQSNLLGSTAAFTGAAVGDSTLSYQWYFNGVPLNDGGRVSGSTTTNLSIANIQTNDAGPYQLVVTNYAGAVTSAVANLTVLVPAFIAVQPTNAAIVLASNVTFSAAAGGTAPFSYLWYSNGMAMANGGRISGATSPNLTISVVQTNDGAAYQVIITNLYGAATSQVATLTVLSPVQITGQPASQAALLGSNATFTVTTFGTSPFVYQWYFNSAPLSEGGRISGSTTPMLIISNVQSSDAGGYFVMVTNPLSSATSLTASLTPQSVLAPSVRYVALTSTNPLSPYLDWTTAATNIQDAIDAAVAGDSIVVSNGTYNVGGRAVYGSATNRVVVNKAVTVQSANGPAATMVIGFNTFAGAYRAGRCVYLTNGASLFGFTLMNGGARTAGDPILEQSGGGIWCESSSAVVSNCIIIGNVATLKYGGGSFGGTLVNCILSNNSASFGGGACSNLLINCTLAKNVSTFQSANVGGGAFGSTLSNCLLVANNCTGGGGGGAALSILSSCVVSNNSANSGGGLASCVAYSSLISSNHAFVYGGGAYSNILNNCTFTNNYAEWGGAAAYATLNQCIITGNRAQNYGGGIYSATAVGCVLAGNSAGILGTAAYGGAILNCTVVSNFTPVTAGIAAINGSGITNSIVYDNAGGNTINTKNIAYTCTTPLIAGPGNFTNAPLFVNEGGGDFHLQSNSPCINSGNNVYVTVTNDFDGNPRIGGGTVDMGAYEYQTPGSLLSYAWAQQYGLPTDGSADYADTDGDGMNNYAEWKTSTNPTNAASLLQLASPSNSVSGVTVTWQSVNSVRYYLQRGTQLPVFSTIVSNILGQAGTTSYLDTTATNADSFFYRVGVQ